jgi:hypothetical protein
MHFCSSKTTLALNSALLFVKQLVVESSLCVSQTFLLLLPARIVKIVRLLEAFQMVILFGLTLRCLEHEEFFLIKFYNFDSLVVAKY